MTKLLKKLLSGVLSMVLLASSVSVAVATDNYEQYLPIITRLE